MTQKQCRATFIITIISIFAVLSFGDIAQGQGMDSNSYRISALERQMSSLVNETVKYRERISRIETSVEYIRASIDTIKDNVKGQEQNNLLLYILIGAAGVGGGGLIGRFGGSNRSNNGGGGRHHSSSGGGSNGNSK